MSNSKNTTPIDLLKAAAVTELAVASLTQARTHSFPIRPQTSFSLELQFDVSAGAPDVKVELEVGGSEPDTEGSSDTDFVIPQALGGGTNQDAIIDSGANTELVRFYPFPPVVAPYGRLLLTGQNANDASCKLIRAIVHQIENG